MTKMFNLKEGYRKEVKELGNEKAKLEQQLKDIKELAITYHDNTTQEDVLMIANEILTILKGGKV